MTRTVSLRLEEHQIEQIKVAALAAHLPIATYMHRRVTDTPILSTPALAALAELVSLTRKLQIDGHASPEHLDEIRALVGSLSAVPSYPADFE